MATDRRPEFFKGGQLKVAIIGCGYVGLPLALRFAEAGHKVTGFDTDPEKVRMLNAGKSYIEHAYFFGIGVDRKSTRLNSSHTVISYAVFCLKKKKANILCSTTSDL